MATGPTIFTMSTVVVDPTTVQSIYAMDMARSQNFDGIAPWKGTGSVRGEAPVGLAFLNGLPAAMNVWLVDAETQRVVAHTVSAADGTYEFTGVNTARQFQCWFEDFTQTYRPDLTERFVPHA